MQIVLVIGQISGSFNSSGETIPKNIMKTPQPTTTMQDINEAYEANDILNAYCTILLGERVPLTLTIAGEEVKQPMAGTQFTRRNIHSLATAHAQGYTVQVTRSEAPARLTVFLEQPLPADITPETVSAYYQSL